MRAATNKKSLPSLYGDAFLASPGCSQEIIQNESRLEKAFCCFTGTRFGRPRALAAERKQKINERRKITPSETLRGDVFLASPGVGRVRTHLPVEGLPALVVRAFTVRKLPRPFALHVEHLRLTFLRLEQLLDLFNTDIGVEKSINAHPDSAETPPAEAFCSDACVSESHSRGET